MGRKEKEKELSREEREGESKGRKIEEDNTDGRREGRAEGGRRSWAARSIFSFLEKTGSSLSDFQIAWAQPHPHPCPHMCWAYPTETSAKIKMTD